MGKFVRLNGSLLQADPRFDDRMTESKGKIVAVSDTATHGPGFLDVMFFGGVQQMRGEILAGCLYEPSDDADAVPHDDWLMCRSCNLAMPACVCAVREQEERMEARRCRRAARRSAGRGAGRAMTRAERMAAQGAAAAPK